MGTLGNIAYAAVCLLGLCGMWIATGFLARIVVGLFCIGYGC